MFDFKTKSGFLAATAAFAAVFWITGFILYSLLTALQGMGGQSSQSGQALDQRYAQQLSETERQIAVSEAQQKRMDALLARQEAQNERFDAVLTKWEQQAARGAAP
jgi:hypothetical protein